jgi:hypothetical protein
VRCSILLLVGRSAQVEPEKIPRERANDLISLLVPDWRPTARQGLWAIRIVLAIVVVLGILALVGRPFGITLWDWLKLLVVPAVIAAGGLWFNVQQREREQRIANERAQDEALQGYLDGMAELLTDKEQPLHRAQWGDNLSTVARARTLTVLGRLDGGRKGSVLQFLFESELIHRERTFLDESGLIKRQRPIVNLAQADLRGADLKGATLNEADLSIADLRGADLREARLTEAVLAGADLRGANLTNSWLARADLALADLDQANLTWAWLTEARGLTEKQLRSALSLTGATMPDGQNLRWTEKQMWEIISLELADGTTMPDGQSLREFEDWIKEKPTLEDWLKSKDREQDG